MIYFDENNRNITFHQHTGPRLDEVFDKKCELAKSKGLKSFYFQYGGESYFANWVHFTYVKKKLQYL